MFGKNKIMKPINHDGDFLDIEEIFLTFQGEGPNVGAPAVFIRLGGCNLACDFCDTEFDNYKKLSLDEILQQINNFSYQAKFNLIVVTGGEPLRQPIDNLCNQLLKQGFKVQIETNGTIFRKLDNRVEIVCSPKSSNNKFFKIRSDLLPKISAFKFIISKSKQPYNEVPQIGQNENNAKIYLQPMDEYDEVKNKENLELAKKLCLINGYNLSLQTHKIIEVK